MSARANPLANAHPRNSRLGLSPNDVAISRDGASWRFDRIAMGPWIRGSNKWAAAPFLNLTNGTRASVLVRNAGFVPDGSEVSVGCRHGGDRLRLVPSMCGPPVFLRHTQNVVRVGGRFSTRLPYE